MQFIRALKVGVGVGALACEGGPTAPAESEARELTSAAAALADGDVIELDVHLRGCFHDNRLVAVLRVVGDSAMVEQFTGTGNLVAGYRFQPVAALSRDQLTGLTDLLSSYERPSKGWCTSSEAGRVSVLRDGKRIRTHTFNDSACRWLGDREPTFHWSMLSDVVEG